MGSLIVTNVYLFILAVVLAVLEIQIEGQHGWAKDLPTWRPKSNNWYIQAYRKIMSGREPTGYHMAMFTFVLLILHLPYVFGLTLTLVHWLQTLSFFFIFVVLWDFLWFVLNPHYPIKKFTKEHIIWHKQWWGGLPRDYYVSVLLALLILVPVAWHDKSWFLVDWWVLNVALFILETILLIIFSHFILDIDNWVKTKK